MNGMVDFTTVAEVINEIKELRGSEVRIFGQPTILNENVDDFTIDVVTVLEELQPYEISYDDCNEFTDFNNPTRSDNSYNWNAPISNDIDYSVYRTDYDEIIISLSVHRYGDVRCNYTDNMLFKFDNEDAFLYTLLENTSRYGYIEVDGKDYSYDITIFHEGAEIYDENGNYICTTYEWELEDIKKDIREAL